MTSHQIYNQNANNKRQNISKSPINSFHRYQYGEKLEKDNYSLYVSGSGYEKTENNRPQEEKQVKKVMKKYHNFNQVNKNDILSSSDNYGFKEIKNLKMTLLLWTFSQDLRQRHMQLFWQIYRITVKENLYWFNYRKI